MTTTPAPPGTPTLGTPESATLGGKDVSFYPSASTLGVEYHRWPFVLRLLAENVARCTTGADRSTMLTHLRRWLDRHRSDHEVAYSPGRLLMHDTTSTPALVDMAAMRDVLAETGQDPETISPLLPVEVSVDHSLAVETYADPQAATTNIREEMRRNRERYRFLKWSSSSMGTVHINPPGTGIMHTFNLEQLATVATTATEDGVLWAFPDQMLGTDSHTPMVNALGVLGWGVGGLEAETVMFGMPTMLKIPDVVGVNLVGELTPGATSTDLALTITHLLRGIGVTGEFVEFFGPGVTTLSVGDRAVVANMAPEYGATTGFFPVDERSLDYLRMTGRPEEHIEFVGEYCRAAGLWYDPESGPECGPEYSRTVTVDLSTVTTRAAGPRRPQDLLGIHEIPRALEAAAPEARVADDRIPAYPVALASITSCTNTTDPRQLITAGLIARKARRWGITPPSWVKTSLAPGSPAATSYLSRSGLADDLEAVGFGVVGFGCATCIGNSGPLTPEIDRARTDSAIRPVAILSGNRNFPGRVHPDLDLGFLMSPALVVAYGLAGDAHRDLTTEPIQVLPDDTPVYLTDLWPSAAEIDDAASQSVDARDFATDFLAASNNRMWKELETPPGNQYPWDPSSTALRPPAFVDPQQSSLLGTYTAHPLLVLGDDVTTDHISPASAIPKDSFIADFLVERGENRDDLNVFASRRGNWEVMARGAYFNNSLHNELSPDGPTGTTAYGPTGEHMLIWDAAERYKRENRSVIVIAGDRYGMGSSRDWAAKVQRLLGVRAVLASSYERIHRSNLIGMGILPLTVPAAQREAMAALKPGDTVQLEATGAVVDTPRSEVPVTVNYSSGQKLHFTARAAIETQMEVSLLHRGGVIPTILDRAAPRPAA
jgi:aconitate hydratase